MTGTARQLALDLSTATDGSSFRNNLPNRFEESYGDAKNLRGRFPLVAMGFLFLLRSTVTADAGTLHRAVDMLRKLQQDSHAYDTTCLVIAEWTNPPAFGGSVVRNDLVPEDLQADRFLATLIDRVLERTPVDMHVEVREIRQQRDLPLDESEEAGESAGNQTLRPDELQWPPACRPRRRRAPDEDLSPRLALEPVRHGVPDPPPPARWTPAPNATLRAGSAVWAGYVVVRWPCLAGRRVSAACPPEVVPGGSRPADRSPRSDRHRR